MKRSATPAVLVGVALLFVSLSHCGPVAEPSASDRATEAWKLYLSQPDPNTYENFIRANRYAAYRHGMPHDHDGVEFQVRTLEVQAAEAVRTKDALMADGVTERIAEIESRDLVGVYEEAFPGAKSRLAAAKALAETVTR